MDIANSERVILAVKHYSKQQHGLGLISPVAEVVDGKMVPLTADNFCATRQVFIPSRYDELDSKFRTGELFRIPVELNTVISEKTANPCKYKGLGSRAEKIQQSEIAEIIVSPLPDRNSRVFTVAVLPSTPYIFTKDDLGQCYGPFEWQQIEDSDGGALEIELKFITGGGLGAVGRTKQIHQISKQVVHDKEVSCEVNGDSRKYVSGVAGFVNNSAYFDYASDKDIVDYIRIIAGDAGSRVVDRKSLSALAALAAKGPQGTTALAKNRLAAFSSLVEDGVDFQELIQDKFDGYLKSETGLKLVEDYVQRNKARYIEQLKKDKQIELDEIIGKKREEIRLSEETYEQMRKTLTGLNDEIERKRREAEKDVMADQAVILAAASAQTTAKLDELKRESEQIEGRLKDLRDRWKSYDTADLLEQKIRDQRVEVRILQSQVGEEKKQLSSLRQEIGKEEDELRKKLRELKPYVEHINGAFITGEMELPSIAVHTNGTAPQEMSPLQRSVVESVQQRFSKRGRSFKDWEVANILISTQQSFITFMAGLPGVGKTSLGRLIAQAQDLSPRLHEVSVARGWTSLKDIVGFHNPLSDRFQASNTGLYQFLSVLDNESKENSSPAMSYVLLDEANLSPIEHYWSEFMGMSDSHVDRKLRIGERVLSIPNNLRFLATINYDGTTEPLSPRVIDRAPILVMNPGAIGEFDGSLGAATIDLPLSASLMESLFGLFGDIPSFEVDEETAFEDVYEVLRDPSSDKGRPVSISQRKIAAIRQYCARARSLMRPEGGALMALDLAILQHVLPQVRGHGQKFAKRMDDLKRTLDIHSLSRSSEYLEKMISYGQADLHSYDFFCW